MPLSETVTKRGYLGWPVVVLAVSLLATTFAISMVVRRDYRRVQAEFDRHVEVSQIHLTTRVNDYVRGLRACAGFIANSKNISAQSFRQYADTVNLARSYPGVQGLGFAVKVGPDITGFEDKAHSLGQPELRVWPVQAGVSERYSILFLEPMDRRNRAAIGFDMSSEVARRTAMYDARDSGDVATTTPVTLVQEIDEKDRQLGFLIYFPVYPPGTPPNIGNRRAAIAGFAYSPLRATDFLQTMASELHMPGISMELFDGKSVDPATLLAGVPAAEGPSNRFSRTVPIEAAGHSWTLRLTGNPRPGETSDAGVALLLSSIGALLSFGLYYISRLLVQSHILAEERAEQAAAASTAKDQFLAKLSHELRTPLTPVLAIISEMVRDERVLPENREQLNIARRNIEMERHLIDDLLDVTRVRHGKINLKIKTINLIKTVRGVARDRAIGREKDLHVAINAGPQPIWVEADPARLAQVVWNLLSNAEKFTPPGGSITLTITTVHPDGEQPQAVLEVRDTGRGIDPKFLPYIFNAFEQATLGEMGGLGLGLAITKSLVEAHGGTITVESEGLGHGACFRVQLPLVPAPPATELAPVNGEKIAGSRLLLVEDHTDTAHMLARLLQRRGFSVTQAVSVTDAKRLIDESTQNPPFDILVSDLGLPDGSGFDVVRHIKSRAAVPAIALSGYGMEEDVARAMGEGFSVHITKPVDFDQLVTAAHSLLGKKSTDEPQAANTIPGR